LAAFSARSPPRSCCIVPLILFSLGIGGAWIGNLTALAPYKPIFVAGTAGLLGYGFYLVYWKPRRACAEGAACARPISNRLVQFALWMATALVIARSPSTMSPRCCFAPDTKRRSVR